MGIREDKAEEWGRKATHRSLNVCTNTEVDFMVGWDAAVEHLIEDGEHCEGCSCGMPVSDTKN